MPGYDVMNGLAGVGVVVFLLGFGALCALGAYLNRKDR